MKKFQIYSDHDPQGQEKVQIAVKFYINKKYNTLNINII